jgi:hypothetical protein
MLLNDIAAAILLQNKQFDDLHTAKDAVKETFKKEFPYWSFAEWDVEVTLPVGKTLLRVYDDSTSVTIKELIVDLPPMVDAFKQIKVN